MLPAAPVQKRSRKEGTLMRPEIGATRCPKDCPNRKVGCHNVKTCENWAKQVEENRERLAKRREKNAARRLSWEERGIRA